MLKTLKRIFLGSLSVLGISTLIWILLLLNPKLSYAHHTQVDQVTIYHNEALQPGTVQVVKDAIALTQKADIYDKDMIIQFCLNDDKLYPSLQPLAGYPLAYAWANKTVMKNCIVDFENNVAESRWEVNQNELRKFDLTYLIAHEFMHNHQYQFNSRYYLSNTITSINWKLEGHAEYVSRAHQYDGKLHEKINKIREEELKEHIGLPVFELEDGTRQLYGYFKYAAVVQYLMEEKKLDFEDICNLNSTFEEQYKEMMEWSLKQEAK